MSPSLRAFLQRWIVTALGVLAATQIVPGIAFDHWAGLLIASLLLGALNAFVRPVLLVVSLPLLLASFGLLLLVINALLLYLVAALVHSFHVPTFGAAFWGGLVISITSFLAHRLIRPLDTPRPPFPPSRPPPHQDPDGPIIDV